MAKRWKTEGKTESGPRPVRKIGSLVNQLLSRRGYASIAAGEELQNAVTSIVGASLGASIRVGNLNRGVLQLYATDSVTMQELMFQKRSILSGLQARLPESKITDIRFRVQAQ